MTTEAERRCLRCNEVIPEGAEYMAAAGGVRHVKCPRDEVRTPQHVAKISAGIGSVDSPIPEDVLNRNTDRANGQEIAKRFDGQMLFVPGVGWCYFDGRRWVPDRHKCHLLVGVLTDALLVLAVVADEVEAKILKGRVKRLESPGGRDGALSFAEALLKRDVTEMDANPLLVNFPNGTYDARAYDEQRRRWGKLREHRAEDYITRLCPTEWHEDATDDMWDKVLAEVFNGDSTYGEAKLTHLRRLAGYTLLGLTNEKKIPVPHGPRDTAKSTVTEALYRALGDVADGGYATTWDAEVVEAGTKINRNEKLDKARAARMIVVGELDKGSRMADGFVKRFSGGDTVDACAKYKPSYSYRPQGKMWLPTNYVPKSADPAVQGRLDLLPFRHVPEKIDRSIKDHLDRDESAHRAVLAWAMRGLREYLDARTAGSEQPLGETPWLDALIQEYARDSNALLDFTDACFDVVDDEVTAEQQSSHVDFVWAAYVAWAQDNVSRPLTRRTFVRAMEECGYVRRRIPAKGGPSFWLGLKIKHSSELPNEVVNALRVRWSNCCP